MHPAGLVGVDRADDVAVIELRRRLGLSVEPLDQLRVSGQGRRQDLEGDHLLESAMLGLEDHAHAAGAELIQHDVSTDHQPLRLPLADRAGLIARQSPRRHQLAAELPAIPRRSCLRDFRQERPRFGPVHQAEVVDGSHELINTDPVRVVARVARSFRPRGRGSPQDRWPAGRRRPASARASGLSPSRSSAIVASTSAGTSVSPALAWRRRSSGSRGPPGHSRVVPRRNSGIGSHRRPWEESLGTASSRLDQPQCRSPSEEQRRAGLLSQNIRVVESGRSAFPPVTSSISPHSSAGRPSDSAGSGI